MGQNQKLTCAAAMSESLDDFRYEGINFFAVRLKTLRIVLDHRIELRGLVN